MKLIDTHCHVHFQAYKEDMDEVIQRSLDEDVQMITVGTQVDTSLGAIEIAEKYNGVWASIGLHPTHTIAHGFNDTQELDFKPRQEAFNTTIYQDMLDKTNKVVGVGECGLDYYRLPEGQVDEMKRLQKESFMAQMEFAAKNELPLIIHCREAHADQYAAIKEGEEQWKSPMKGVIHCFTGTYEEAKKYVENGWMISFSGIATFADAVGDVAKKLPLDSILVETDAPYLTPPPYRGKRNEPWYVKFVAEDIAKRRGISFEEMAKATVANARKIFNLDQHGR